MDSDFLTFRQFLDSQISRELAFSQKKGDGKAKKKWKDLAITVREKTEKEKKGQIRKDAFALAMPDEEISRLLDEPMYRGAQ